MRWSSILAIALSTVLAFIVTLAMAYEAMPVGYATVTILLAWIVPCLVVLHTVWED